MKERNKRNTNKKLNRVCCKTDVSSHRLFFRVVAHKKTKAGWLNWLSIGHVLWWKETHRVSCLGPLASL